MRPLSEIIHAFDHLSTQGYNLVKDGLRILGVLVGSQDFATHFLDEVLSQNMVHVNDLPLLRDTHVALGIFFSCVTHRPSYFTWTILFFFSLLSLLAGLDEIFLQICVDIMGLGSWKSFQGPLMKH
jgi:hypothetical protein